jgi:hypothetical protein
LTEGDRSSFEEDTPTRTPAAAPGASISPLSAGTLRGHASGDGELFASGDLYRAAAAAARAAIALNRAVRVGAPAGAAAAPASKRC